MARSIRQTVTIRGATPRDVYDALMDSRQHSRIIGDKARIKPTVGAKFDVFSGYATGENLELARGKRIVQTWRASDWPSGVNSTITFKLEAVPGGTRLNFTQTGVPDDQYDSIKRGWKEFYWAPLKEFFAG
jgi:activator of HSP90 ATPase